MSHGFPQAAVRQLHWKVAQLHSQLGQKKWDKRGDMMGKSGHNENTMDISWTI